MKSFLSILYDNVEGHVELYELYTMYYLLDTVDK